MAGFDPFTLALGGISALPSVLAGISQRAQANRLKLADTTTAAERESLALSRQAAATNRLPNQGYQENRLAQVQAGAVQNARLGAGSSADFLASAGAADARRQQGEQQLGIQGLAYNDKSKQQLRQDLTTQSNRQQHDLDVYNNTKSALTQGSATNLNNAVQIGAAGAAIAHEPGPYTGEEYTDADGNFGREADKGYDPVAPRIPKLNQLGASTYSPPNTLPNYPMGGFGRRSNRYNMGTGNYYGQ